MQIYMTECVSKQPHFFLFTYSCYLLIILVYQVPVTPRDHVNLINTRERAAREEAERRRRDEIRRLRALGRLPPRGFFPPGGRFPPPGVDPAMMAQGRGPPPRTQGGAAGTPRDIGPPFPRDPMFDMGPNPPRPNAQGSANLGGQAGGAAGLPDQMPSAGGQLQTRPEVGQRRPDSRVPFDPFFDPLGPPPLLRRRQRLPMGGSQPQDSSRTLQGSALG